MGKRTKFGKYSRRTSLDNNGAKLTPIIISIAVFVLLCVVISFVVGLLLGKKAESIGFVSDFEISEESYYSGDKLVSPVEAYYYEPGMKVGTYVSKGITDFSLCLRHSDGSLAFDTYSFASEGYEKIVFDESTSEPIIVEVSEKEYLESQIGRTVSVLFEQQESNGFIGHSKEYYNVFVEGQNLQNKVCNVLIKELNNDTLIGEIVE